MAIFSRISGTGSALPARRLTNADLVDVLAERGLETSDQWIVERTGIRARHFVDDGVNASDLAFTACEAALQAAGCPLAEIDLIVVATSTPDMVFPSTATILQRKLTQAAAARGEAGAAGGAAFDVQAVCSGFVYALTVVDALIRTGTSRKALVVGAEVFSRILDFNDRTTCVLFGDGAGAVVLEACEHDGSGPGVLATDVHADGKHTGILCVPGTVSGGQVLGDPTLKMDGQAVFKLAVGVLEDAARAVLAKAGKVESDIDWLVPHQANIRIMQGTARKLKLPMDKVVVTVDQHGNTSAASIPLALDSAVRAGQVRPGHLVMLEGVGGGFTWGAALVKM
ncbi:MAG: beta-ketoacyl-ACP synthase III [Burkholderiaceae bacterium]